MPEEVRLHSLSTDVVICSPDRAEVRLNALSVDVVVQVVPGPPQNLRQTSATSTTTTLEWDPATNGLTPEGYEYKVGVAGEVTTASSPLVVTGFSDQYATLEVYIRAFARGAYSSWSQISTSPSVALNLVGVRPPRTSSLSIDNKILRFYVTTTRQRRVSDIAFERDINVRVASTRRRRLSSISFQRPTITFSFSRDRRRRVSSFTLDVEVASFSAFVTRRRRVSSIQLNRPAASITLSGTRSRRNTNFRVLFPDQLLYANMLRRTRTSNLDVDVFYPIVSIYDGETPIQVLHSDNVWREIGIRP